MLGCGSDYSLRQDSADVGLNLQGRETVYAAKHHKSSRDQEVAR